MVGPALSLLRLTARSVNKPLLLRCTVTRTTTTAPFQKQTITATFSTTNNVTQSDRKVREGEGFWKKNDRMKRPMSPHITIYSFPLPAIMSITNRVTGLAWSFVIAGAGIGALMYPGDSAAFLAMVKALEIPMPVLATAKFMLLWPFMYHTVNGVRHLVWDYSRGLHIPEIYRSGWLIAGLSVLGTAGMVAYCSI